MKICNRTFTVIISLIVDYPETIEKPIIISVYFSELMRLLSLLYNYQHINKGSIEKKKADKEYVRVSRLQIVSFQRIFLTQKSKQRKQDITNTVRMRMKREERTHRQERSVEEKGGIAIVCSFRGRRQVCISQRPAAKRETGIAAGVP